MRRQLRACSCSAAGDAATTATAGGRAAGWALKLPKEETACPWAQEYTLKHFPASVSRANPVCVLGCCFSSTGSRRSALSLASSTRRSWAALPASAALVPNSSTCMHNAHAAGAACCAPVPSTASSTAASWGNRRRAATGAAAAASRWRRGPALCSGRLLSCSSSLQQGTWSSTGVWQAEGGEEGSTDYHTHKQRAASQTLPVHALRAAPERRVACEGSGGSLHRGISHHVRPARLTHGLERLLQALHAA